MVLKIDDSFEIRRGNLSVMAEGYKRNKSRTTIDENIHFTRTNHYCKSSEIITTFCGLAEKQPVRKK